MLTNQKDIQIAIHSFIKAREAVKAAETEKARLQTELLDYADRNGLTRIESGDTKLSVIRGKEKQNQFDLDKFRAECPEIYARYCTKTTPARAAYIR